MGAAVVATFEQFWQFYHPGSPTYRPDAGKDVVVMSIFRKIESVKNSFTVQERSKRKNNTKSGLQCVSNSFMSGQRTWTGTSRGPKAPAEPSSGQEGAESTQLGKVSLPPGSSNSSHRQ